MKKIFSILLFVLMTSVLCSKSFFGTRYFETKVTMPVTVSNNTFGVFDFFQKEVVIDFTQLAKEMPSKGFEMYYNVSPSFEITLNINEHFKFGPRVGINVFGTSNISKSFFDFIGEGNKLNETLVFSASSNADFFAYVGALVGVKIGKLRVGITPQVFFPIATTATENFLVTVENSPNGDVEIVGNGTVAAYSNLNVNTNVESITKSDSINQIINSIQSGMGFDLEGYFGWDYSKALSLDLNYKVPIRYGKYDKRLSYGVDFEVKTSVSDLANGEIKKEFNFDKEPKKEDVEYKIFRPMKFNLALRFAPLGNFLTFNALGGVGINHPFMDDMQVFPEYYFAAKISLIGLLSAQVSTEYLDKCFSHSFITSINLRLIQLDLGVSVSSTDFEKSFQGTGLGGFVSVAVGF